MSPIFQLALLSYIQALVGASNDTAMAQEVAIIGAGLSGLSLALALNQQSISCIVYEGRSAPEQIGGTIILSPNALSVLDALGVYQRLKPHGCECEDVDFRTQDDQVVDSYKLGDEVKYGYKSLRTYRHVIIAELTAALLERDVPMQFGKRYSHILSETENRVCWKFEDGTVGQAETLVGADGIHSRVRQYLFPDVVPQFTKVMAITAAVPSSQVRVPGGYRLPVTIMSEKHGGYLLAFQQPDESEIVVGKQMNCEELDKAELSSLTEDKQWCIEFLRRGASEFPEIVQRCVADIPTDKINVWPFYVVPKLDDWVSEKGSVVILGDAAHAIPPSSGQGANQVFEDSYTYALICAQSEDSLKTTLPKWKTGRQERIDKLHLLAQEMNARRLPGSSTLGGHGQKPKMSGLEMDWLYGVDLKEMVRGWIDDSRMI